MSNPNGNADYETYWTDRRDAGWVFLALTIIGLLIYEYWIDATIIQMMAFTCWGLTVAHIRLGNAGREQASILQEREGEIEWALNKLKENNIKY